MTPLRLPALRPESMLQPLLAMFPHGLQHQARRNACRAAGEATAGRRDRLAADTAVAGALDDQTTAVRERP